jgi:hypothetical protein
MRPLPAAFAAAALGGALLLAQEPPAQAPAPEAAAERPADAERSTGQIEKRLEPAAPPPPTPIALPADRPALVRDGTVSAATTAHFAFTPTADRMIEIRIRSADERAALSIFRGEATEPELGTDRAAATVGWISSTESGGVLRIVIWTTSEAETPYQLLVRVHPPEPAGPAPPEG